MTTTDQNRDRILNVLLHAVFFLSGITTVLIGQVLPILANRFVLNDLQSGYLFPAQFSGSLAGTLMTSWFGRTGNLVRASAFGSVLMAAGILIMNSGSFPVVLAGFFVNGLGVGLTLPAINILILERNQPRSASALNFLNFFWGLGAIVSKPFVDGTAVGTDLFWTTVVIAIPLAAFALVMFALPKTVESTVARREDEPEGQTPIWSTPVAWAIAGFNFIHIGFEGGMGGWLTTYTARIDGGSAIHLFSPTLLYFLFFVIGRGVAPVFFRFLDENKMLFLGLMTILAGLLVTLTADGIFLLGLGAAICGFGTSSIFPTNVSRFSRTFGADAMRRATPLFICGTLGAAAVTWLIGFLSDRTGSLRSGMFILALSISTLIILQIGLSRRKENKMS